MDNDTGIKTITTPGSSILRIDRTIKPTYPSDDEEAVYPEFENTGPTHLDPSRIIPYLHPQQENGGSIDGEELHKFLRLTGLIKQCLDLRVGEEFVNQPHCFPVALRGKVIFLWKSIVRYPRGSLISPDYSENVPYIFERNGVVSVHWMWIGGTWFDYYLTGLSVN